MKTKTNGTEYTTLELIRDIIIQEMAIDPDRVNFFNQKFKVPPDDGLFIMIDAKGAPKVISNRNKAASGSVDVTEYQNVCLQELLAVSLFSRSMEAYTRAHDVLMAMGSIYSQQKQEEHSFKIARVSSIENLSGLEGASMLNRYETSLVVFSWHEKIKLADFYDTFTAELNTEKETVEISLT